MGMVLEEVWAVWAPCQGLTARESGLKGKGWGLSSGGLSGLRERLGSGGGSCTRLRPLRRG